MASSCRRQWTGSATRTTDCRGPLTGARTRTIAGEPGSKETDWLLTPEPIDDGFAADVRQWLDRLATCTADRNPRLPVVSVARHVLRRYGVRGFSRRTFGYLRERLRVDASSSR